MSLKKKAAAGTGSPAIRGKLEEKFMRSLLVLVLLLTATVYGVVRVNTSMRSKASETVNGQLDLTGPGYVKIPSEASLPDRMGDFTIEMWLTPVESFTGIAGRNVITKGYTTFSTDEERSQTVMDYRLFVIPQNDGTGILDFVLYDSSIYMSTSALGSTPIRAGGSDKYHVAVVKQDLNLSIYLNGKLDAHTRLAANPATNPNTPIYLNTFVGRNPDEGTLESYSGLMDDLRISNIARYLSDFSVPVQPLNQDENTLMLFNFDGNLDDAAVETREGIRFGDVQFVNYPELPIAPFCPRTNLISYYETYYGSAKINDQAAAYGTQIRIWSPREELVGCGIVSIDGGKYPFTRAYGSQEGWEGLELGDSVSFSLNNYEAMAVPPEENWLGNGSLNYTDLFVTTIVPTPTPVIMPNIRSGMSCNQVCGSAGLECVGIGTDEWATDAEYARLDTKRVCARDVGDCLTKIQKSSVQSECWDNQVWWTNCRCGE